MGILVVTRQPLSEFIGRKWRVQPANWIFLADYSSANSKWKAGSRLSMAGISSC